jgi:hypothetical protein
MMVLSIMHGLRPNPKLNAILEGCANLDHLWGLDFPQPLFGGILPSQLCIYPIHPHHQCATQILYWVCHAPRSGPGAQPTQKVAKKKKAYQSGRPIISLSTLHFDRPMLNILARMIFQLIPVACPNHFATGDVYTLLKILHEAPDHGDLILFNQDLAGFFTSIDPARLFFVWYVLLDFLPSPVSDNEAFSVCRGKSNNPGDLIKGQSSMSQEMLVIKDVPALIKTALDMHAFALGQRSIRQRRGSPMGSPLSPALCLMVVSINEQIWFINFMKR